jgi:hypothetical protein
LEDKLELHKQVLKRISDELEKLKHAEGNLPEVNFFIYKLISIFFFFTLQVLHLNGYMESAAFISSV